MSSPEPTPNQLEGACLALSLPLTRWRVPCLALSLPLTRWRVLCRACPRVRPSHSAAPSHCCRPRYREVWGDIGRFGEMWGDMGRYGERCAQPLLPAEI